MTNPAVEAVLLTGGASRRMGAPKAELLVEGMPVSHRIVRELSKVVAKITVLGKSPLEGCEFLADAEEFEGPLVALSRFRPSAEFVFVSSCDLPLFDGRLVGELLGRMGEEDAVIPEYGGRLQPLCALYRARVFGAVHDLTSMGERRMTVWLDRISVQEVAQSSLTFSKAVASANTPEEWADLLSQESVDPFA